MGHLDSLSVYIAIPTHRDLHPAVVRALLETQEMLFGLGVKPQVEFRLSSLIHHSRSVAAHAFLNSGCNRLFWIDSDVAWDAKDFVRFLVHSLREDIVCGVYPRRSEPTGFFVRLIPEARPDDHGLLEIEGAGIGFCCVRRGVIEHLSKIAPTLIFPGVSDPIPAVFRCDDDGEEARGEDFAFFSDCRAAGYAVKCDPTITLSHLGHKAFVGRLADALIKELVG